MSKVNASVVRKTRTVNSAIKWQAGQNIGGFAEVYAGLDGGIMQFRTLQGVGDSISIVQNPENLAITVDDPPVDTVFGRDGEVVAVFGDYTTDTVENTSTVQGLSTTNALQQLASDGGSTQAQLDAHKDDKNDPHEVTSSQVENLSTVPGNHVTDALQQIDSDLGLHEAQTNNPHDVKSSQVENQSLNVGGDNVTAALNELDSDINTVSSDLAAHVARKDDPHDVKSSQVENQSVNVAGANVTNALDQLDVDVNRVAADLVTHEIDTANPHQVNSDQVDNNSGVAGSKVTQALNQLDSDVGTVQGNLTTHEDNTNNPHATKMSLLGDVSLGGLVRDQLLVSDGSIWQNSKGIGSANGVCPLGADGKVPAQFGGSQFSLRGGWDAATNDPDIANLLDLVDGNYWIVDVAGNTNLGLVTDAWNVGDWAVFSDNEPGNWIRVATGAQVSAVFGRTGSVVAATNDYNASQVSNDSTVAGSTVMDALSTLDIDTDDNATAISDHEALTNNPHLVRSNQVPNDSTVVGVDVDDALTQLNTDISTHVANTNDPHDVTSNQVTNDSGIVSGANVTQAIEANKSDIGDNSTAIGNNATAIGLNTTHRQTTTGNPHAISSADVPDDSSVGGATVSNSLDQTASDLALHTGDTGNPHLTKLAALDDVLLTLPAQGDILVFTGVLWANAIMLEQCTGSVGAGGTDILPASPGAWTEIVPVTAIMGTMENVTYNATTGRMAIDYSSANQIPGTDIQLSTSVSLSAALNVTNTDFEVSMAINGTQIIEADAIKIYLSNVGNNTAGIRLAGSLSIPYEVPNGTEISVVYRSSQDVQLDVLVFEIFGRPEQQIEQKIGIP